ncbi:hypothetical protein QWZ13_14750 [Reinekea marina]|nr:hypothetical protein [Reinekea marina]MDN3650175.1 hypothetical protein [Reinekea marina]
MFIISLDYAKKNASCRYKWRLREQIKGAMAVMPLSYWAHSK